MKRRTLAMLFAGQLLLAVCSPRRVAAATPVEPLSVDLSLQDMMLWNTNFDDTHTATYNTVLTEKFSPNIGFVAGIREGAYGAPAGSATTPHPVYNWTGTGLNWLRTIHSQPWMQGRWLLIQPLGSVVYEGVPPYETAWESNLRWRFYNLAKQFPTSAGIRGWLHTNEPDNVGSAGQGVNMLRDFTNKTSDAALAASLERNVRYARVQYEQLRGINQPANMMLPEHPGFIAGPTGAFPSYTRRSTSSHLWSVADILKYNAGEVLDYYEAVDYHFHNVGMYRIETFTDAPPSEGAYSPYHIWRAMNEANTLRVAGGKAKRQLPLVTSETGWGEENWAYYPPGGITSGSTFYPDLEAYKGYKLGAQFCCAHWYGFSMWVWYTLAHSYAPTDYNSLKTNYAEKKHYATIIDIHDWRKYDINNFTTYPLNFSAKTWEQFNRPYTWAIHYDASRYPTASDFPPAIPFPEWRVITFGNNSLTMAARSGSRNLAYRPIYLRSLAPHVFEVDVTVSGGASVKLRARGYDKRNGLAQVVDASTTSRTLRVQFKPQQHNMGRGLPDPAYVLIALDHNGTGTATWSNARISTVETSAGNWREYDHGE